MIRAAYDKLDVNGDGTVKLDDVAKLYTVKGSVDVETGKLSEKDAYL